MRAYVRSSVNGAQLICELNAFRSREKLSKQSPYINNEHTLLIRTCIFSIVSLMSALYGYSYCSFFLSSMVVNYKHNKNVFFGFCYCSCIQLVFNVYLCTNTIDSYRMECNRLFNFGVHTLHCAVCGIYDFIFIILIMRSGLHIFIVYASAFVDLDFFFSDISVIMTITYILRIQYDFLFASDFECDT